MNIRKVAVVSILCVAVAISAFLIYDLFRLEAQENLKNHFSVSIEKVDYYNFQWASYPIGGWYVSGCDVNLTICIHSSLESDANVTFNVTILRLWKRNEYKAERYITETVFVQALQNKNVTVTASMPDNSGDNHYSAEILDVQESAR